MSAAIALAPARALLAPRRALLWGVALAVAALVLRINAASRSLWLDEAISVYQVDRPIRDLLLAQVNGFHPPLYHLQLHYWIAAFGESPLALRALSMAWSLVAVAALAAWSREAFPELSPVPAALLAAVGPFAVWYGSEARMYAQLLALSALAGWLAWRLLGRGVRPARLAGLALTLAALAYTHYFGMLFVITLAGVALTAAVASPLRTRALAVLAGLGIALTAVAPWLVYVAMHRHAAGVGPEYPAPDLFSVLIAALEMLVGFHSPVALGALAAGWPALCLLAMALLPRMRRVHWRVSGLFALTAVPPLLLVVASALARNVFDPRYLTVSVAPLYILLGALWQAVPAGRWRRAGGAALVALACAVSVVEVTDAGNPKLYQLREAMAAVRADTAPGDALVLAPDFQRKPVVHYYGAPAGVRVIPAIEPAGTWRAARGAQRVALVSEFDDAALAGTTEGPEAFRRYFAAHGRLVAKHTYAHTTVRIYQPREASER